MNPPLPLMSACNVTYWPSLTRLRAKTRDGLNFISHDLNLVAEFCDRVLIMYRGCVIEVCQAKALHQASHPYTRGLLTALPRLDQPSSSLSVMTRDLSWADAGKHPWLIGGNMAILEIEKLDVWFGSGSGRVNAVKSAQFSVTKGESFGLVGESGSGKSTILRAIAGLVPSWSGRMEIKGQTLKGQRRDRQFYRTVQMVFQDPYAALHPRHTVDRVLSETLTLHGVKQTDARIQTLLDNVGLSRGFRFRYPHQLSGGQRQRIAIARALAGKPDILLLDEPTSALDVSIQAEVLNLLKDLREKYALTYIMVSHDLPVIGHMCDRLAVMQHGQIVEIMDVATLRQGKPKHAYARALPDASKSVG